MEEKMILPAEEILSAEDEPARGHIDGELLSFTVSEKLAGNRLDVYLHEKLPEISRSFLKERINDGLCSLRGKTVRKAGTSVAAGDEVRIFMPAPVLPEAEPEDIPLDILYEDDDVLVVNKPKGMAVHPAPGSERGTLVNALLYHCKGQLSGINGVLRPGIVHRIDKDTTGSLIVCKNDRAHAAIAAQLKEHSALRVYYALAVGNIAEDSGTIRGNIGRDPKDRKRMAVVEEGGKPAVTHFEVLERFGNLTYLRFRLETGRTHQIRVHMKKIRHPLLGDTLYGGEKPGFLLHGQTLHAGTIGFTHPATGEFLRFDAPLPEYFQELLREFREAKQAGRML